MLWKNECTKNYDIPTIVIEDKVGGKSQLRVLNKSRQKVKRILIDDCEIKEGRRCDYALEYQNKIMFVELKGKDVLHGLSQIKETYLKLKNTLPKKKELSGIVVSTKLPPLISNKVQVEQAKIKKQLRLSVLVKKTPYELNI